jgi:two-component system response regulator AtoC
MQARILIVDDNEAIFESLQPNFYQFGLETVYASDGAEAEETVTRGSVDAVLLDIMLETESGIDVLQRIKKINRHLPVIMITGYASIQTAVESMKLGAFDYVKKPLDFDRLFKVVENALELYKLSEENLVLKRRIRELSSHIYAENTKMTHVIEKATKLAQTDIPILIVGENGSGKEVVADYIHAYSSRAPHKMLKINCAAFPESLLDNELFGHEKGAYTGAENIFKGVFERANGSTLFLDEIGDMPVTIQAKILRVLQNNEIRRIGGAENFKVDVRFVAATNKDIGDLINKGMFRQDLFYRLNAAILSVPPLRERKEDIVLLAEYFLEEFSNSHGKEVRKIDTRVLEFFQQYSWPGNVRELRNTLNYAVAITSHRNDRPRRSTTHDQTGLQRKFRRSEHKRGVGKGLDRTDPATVPL